ncbi:MAG: rhomboid family intramembrane serine protease [Chitinophagales bacterium]|nr:rhomboid family intramembrane serine protease [Chitinophagales bacterium]MDW8428421.1 rhomboid family intramembrane serine protease [Chitinophagales bacterium]
MRPISARARVSVLIPLYFTLLLWAVELLEWAVQGRWEQYGIMPREVRGLIGVLLAPFLHDNFSHLISNSIPLVLLGAALIYFYGDLAYRVVLITWVIDGLGVWLMGRPSYHIGASGLVYGMTSFVFFSGLLRKNRSLLSLSLAVVFVYGGLVWGMLPYLTHLSWEGHLMGFLCGIVLAVLFRNMGPGDDPLPQWMHDEDDWPQMPEPSSSQTDVSDQTKPG